MAPLESELARDFLAECGERLVSLEAELLAIREDGAALNPQSIDRVFRALHWMQAAATLFDLTKIRDLARGMEGSVRLIRSRDRAPGTEQLSILLDATECLRDLIENPETSNQADISPTLESLAGDDDDSLQGKESPRALRILLAEDDFSSRLLLQIFLSNYGECHIAVNGKEAVEIFRYALEHGQRYDLICMDIMMPEMDGREAVKRIRQLEEEHGIRSTVGAKIVMTTAVDEMREVARCFQELCDSYLTKPIELDKLLAEMRAYRLIG